MNAFTLLFACVAATSSAQYVAHPRVYSPRVVGAYSYAAGAPSYAVGALPATYNVQVVGKTISTPYATISTPYAATTRVVATPAPFKTVAAPLVAAAPYAAPYASAARVVAAPAPALAVAAAPVAAVAPENVASQFHAQDEFGNYQYGYANINSQKHEIGNVNTGVEGTYSHVDANGEIQTTNLPVAPVAALRHKRSAPIAPIGAPLAGYPTGLAYAGYAGYAGLPAAGYGYAGLPSAGYGYAGLPHAGYGYAGLPVAPAVAPAAVVVSAPATAEAELHTVKLNPGHAVAYRVY